MLAQLWSLCAGPALQAELWVEPPAGRSRMTGSGLFVMRPPAGLEAALDAIQPWLQARLARRPGGGTRVCRRPGA